jgi:hypothetical protein
MIDFRFVFLTAVALVVLYMVGDIPNDASPNAHFLFAGGRRRAAHTSGGAATAAHSVKLCS